MDIKIGFQLLTVIAFIAWGVFFYWQIRLIKRIHVISREQHKIPENIFWLKRARLARDADETCQQLWRKRNISALPFLISLIIIGGLMAFSVIKGA